MSILKNASILILALTLTGWAAEKADDKHASHHASSPMAEMIAPKTGAEFEAMYLAMMIHHHRDGIKMAQMAVEKASSDELKRMMQKSTGQQQKEVEEMTGWLKQWHQKAPEDFEPPKDAVAKMKRDMAEVNEAAGKTFDQVFARKMAHHHMGAVEMGRLASKKAEHPEVKASGAKIAESQEQERAKLMRIAGGQH